MTEQSHIVHKKNHGIGFWRCQRILRDGEACNCGHGHDRRCKMADKNEMCIQNCGIRTSLVNICRPKVVQRRRILWWHHAAWASSGEQANAADTCIGWTCYYGSSNMWMRSVFTVIELSYRYRDIFDLSYHLSIKNSIWHILTALVIFQYFIIFFRLFNVNLKTDNYMSKTDILFSNMIRRYTSLHLY